MLHIEQQSIADLCGPWVDPDWDSGLIKRCKAAWKKPIRELTNEELAMFLRQNIAPEQILSVAKRRIVEGIDDGTEIYAGELAEIFKDAKARRSL